MTFGCRHDRGLESNMMELDGTGRHLLMNKRPATLAGSCYSSAEEDTDESALHKNWPPFKFTLKTNSGPNSYH